jgi:hypothetical protein
MVHPLGCLTGCRCPCVQHYLHTVVETDSGELVEVFGVDPDARLINERVKWVVRDADATDEEDFKRGKGSHGHGSAERRSQPSVMKRYDRALVLWSWLWGLTFVVFGGRERNKMLVEVQPPTPRASSSAASQASSSAASRSQASSSAASRSQASSSAASRSQASSSGGRRLRHGAVDAQDRKLQTVTWQPPTANAVNNILIMRVVLKNGATGLNTVAPTYCDEACVRVSVRHGQHCARVTADVDWRHRRRG